MEPLRRSTRTRKAPKWVSDGMQSHGFLTNSEDLIATSSSKREHDEENDDDYEPDGQRPAKRSKISSVGGLVCRGRSSILKDKKISAAFKFNNDIWMVILEHCTPATLRKARCLSKEFHTLIDKYQNLLVESRFQTYGLDMQTLPEGLSERQFSILLEGKGCMSCNNKRVTFTHWSWCKRWCTMCWEEQVMTETSARGFLREKGIVPIFEDQIINALPWGMRDSWGNPHPLLEEAERPSYRGVVKTFSKEDLETICEDFEALTPALPLRRAGMTAQQFRAVMAQWHRDIDAVPMRRQAFFNQHIANAKMIMEKALIIDKAVRAKGRKDKEIKRKNRESRAQFFKECAKVDLPDVPAECVKISQPFLSAIKIGTDGGSPRSWAILKPKIRQEWNTLYTDGMKKTMWDYDAIQKERERMAALAIEEDYAAEEEDLDDGETTIVNVESVEVIQSDEDQDEEDGESEPYSIWKDRDLACEYYKYSRSVAERMVTTKKCADDSGEETLAGVDDATATIPETMGHTEIQDKGYNDTRGTPIENPSIGESVENGDGYVTDNGFGTDDDSSHDNGSID